ATDGNFYGTTYASGIAGGGTIFRLIPQVKLTRLAIEPLGAMRLEGTGPPGRGWRLWGNSDIRVPFSSWALVATGTFDDAGNLTYQHISPTADASHFYRVTVP